ncbi:MAG: DNA-binding protein WhiA [Clostridiales bacterium]|nr:DNA-binding protein WhiA [Clostridiales bacterium]
MSFSGTVKEELSRHPGTARHCQIAELAAFLCACGHLEPGKPGEKNLVIQTENESVARKCFTILQKVYNIEAKATVRANGRTKRGNVYQIRVGDPADGEMILQSTRLAADEETGSLVLQDLLVVQKECCKRAYIRGAFLASGSISDPRKGYHFEIVCPEERKARQLKEMIHSFHIDARIVTRKKSYVVYVKEGAQIVDMLAIMEANVALMDLENIRIVKEMRNSVNRRVNCETANINKTVNAAVKQMEDIALIGRTVGFQSLSEGLAQTAELRLQHPEATLKELGMMLNPQVGKSGVNHRLRKLSALADELRENEEDCYDKTVDHN